MLDNLVTLLLFLFVFCLIVVSHEFGHYIIAKINGIHVAEFGIGMGPRLLHFHRNGTDYCIRLLPIGGACIYDLEQEELETPKPNEIRAKATGINTVNARLSEDDHAVANHLNDRLGADAGFFDEYKGVPFNKARVGSRIATIVAGPLFNFILAYLLALIVVWFTGTTNAEITSVMDGYPAKEAGIQAGDIITKMNGSRVYLSNEIYLNTYINKSADMTITYLRDGKKHTVTVTPKYNEETGRYLIGFNGYGIHKSCKDTSVFKCAYYEVRYVVVGTVKSLLMLLAGNGSKDDIAGPVGMAQIIDETKDAAAPYGVWVVMLNMLNIAMLLSVNLGILNLLPLPAIDGGRLVFLIVEAVRGKPVPPEKESIVHLVGVALLIVLMIFVMYNDIVRLFS